MTAIDSDVAARQQLIARQREHLFPSVGTYYRDPLVLVRGRGAGWRTRTAGSTWTSSPGC